MHHKFNELKNLPHIIFTDNDYPCEKKGELQINR